MLSKEAMDLSMRSHAKCSEEEIVISGISGQFPKTRGMNEFAKNLYEKVDLGEVTDSLWKEVFPELPEKIGKSGNVKKFDATFFGVHYKQAHLMDPSLRFILECAYETILDAGINPQSIRGSNTGVFIASTFLDMDKIFYTGDKLVGGGFSITGCNRAMLANRISYAFDLQGPSTHVDTMDNASLSTLDVAYSAIRNGQCDAAIVGGSNVILHPYITAQLSQLGMLSEDGVTRCFDKDMNGYRNSEATCCIYLQKAKDAKRIYARIVHSKMNHSGYVEEGYTQPCEEAQTKFLEQFYKEVAINPASVHYVETHSVGILEYDTAEMNSLDTVLCSNRKRPLKVGCVKSNMGNAQPCGGMCGIAKVIIGMENNSIPPNMNLNQLHPDLKAIVEGRMEVVTEAEEIKGKCLMAVNSLSFTGGNSHILLESMPKDKINKGQPDDDLPRLVTWSGRTEESSNEMFNFMESCPLDAEFVALVHETQVETASNNLFRGYGLFQKGPDGGNAVCLSRDVQHFPGMKRPIVWVFSGMGSQWTQMGSSLMCIPTFRKSIEYCHEIMRSKDLDLIHILTSDDPTIYDNILHSFVGIAAIQIAIVDVLRSLNIQPDLIVGHSVGELGCAYADGCFTAEEMILAAYFRGKVSVDTEKIFGSMAAVGLGYKKVRSLLPADIEVACRNSAISSTISGPAKSVETFVADLKQQGIFAKEVACSNIAYHSRYIADMGPKLLYFLTETIKHPKRRSEKWLSTSIPQTKWDLEESQYSSAQYHTNNLLNPVLFEDTFAMIPNHALTIEIAPHGLLQAIIKKSKSKAIHIPLTQRGNPDNTQFFLTALGKIFLNGIDFPIKNLYAPIQFPVSSGTPMISPLIHWDHSVDWYVPHFSHEHGFKSGKRQMIINSELPEFNFVFDYKINGNFIFPPMGFIFSIWETFALFNGKAFFETDIEFSDIRFLKDLNLTLESERNLLILIQPGTGFFEISEGKTSVILSGYIRIMESAENNFDFPVNSSSEYPKLNAKDFYNDLHLRGYQYKKIFRTVEEVRSDGSWGKVKFQNNWIAFLDSLLQIFTIGQNTRDLMLPKSIQILTLRPQEILKNAKENDGFINVTVCKELMTISAGGIEMFNPKMKVVRKAQVAGTSVSEFRRFIPHLPAPELSTENAARVCVQTFLDSSISVKIKIVEVDSCEDSQEIISRFRTAVDDDLPDICGTFIYLSSSKISLTGITVEAGKLSSLNKLNMVIGKRCFRDSGFIVEAQRSLSDGGYFISREEKNIEMKDLPIIPEFNMILYLPVENETLIVLKKSSRNMLPNSTVFEVSENMDKEWLKNIQEAANRGPVTLISNRESHLGITRIVNMIRRMIPNQIISCFSIEDKKFSDSSYKTHVELDMATNVFREGKWGSYRYLKLSQNTRLESTAKHSFVGLSCPNSELKWFTGNLSETNKKSLISVMFCGLNLRDKELVSGENPFENLNLHVREREMALGIEYAGITKAGQRVMGIVHHGALSNKITSDEFFTFPVPNHWTLEEAATVPMAYLTIYWAFFFRISIKPGRSILIHSAADELGIAAIRVALAYNLEVFVTVDSPQKKSFLMKIFPELKEDHIGSCSDLSFEGMIKVKTKNVGVQYVFNTLKTEKLLASTRCLGIAGKFLQMSKFDMIENNLLGLGIFLNELEFLAVEIDAIFREDCEDKHNLIKLFSQDIQRGIIQPIPSTVFNASDVNEAFGYYNSTDHMGKVLLKIRDNPKEKTSLPIPINLRFSAQKGVSYIVFGGLDGFGIEFTDWLVNRGAEKLVVSSLGKSLTNYQMYRLKIWQECGIEVVYRLENQGRKAQCLELLEIAEKMGPIGGIFNTCLCNGCDQDDYFDGIFSEITEIPTKNFDELSRKLCPNLCHFIILSRRSTSSEDLYHILSQSSLSAIEEIVEERVSRGYPGKVIYWGPLEGKTSSKDIIIQNLDSCLSEIDKLILSKESIVFHTFRNVSKERNILDTVKYVLGLDNIKSLDTTLKSLALDYDILLKLKRHIQMDFDLSFTTLSLQVLTCRQLQELARERALEEKGELILTNDRKPKGLEILLQHLKDVNSTAEKRITRIPSRDRSIKFNSCVVFIPGLVEILETDLYDLSLNVSLPVFSLHITEDVGLLSIPELARNVFQDVKKDALQMSETFYLVGYSFGVFLTLELARLLEQDGMSGQILIIDGSPEFFKLLLLEQLIEDFTEEDVEELIVTNILRVVFSEENPHELWKKWRIQNWQERVEKLVEVCRIQNVYSEDYIRYITEFLYRRIHYILDGSSGKIVPVNSPITLVRPTDVSVMDIERDYGVSRWTRGKFHLRFIKGDHASMLRNRNLSRIINEYDPIFKSNRQFEDYIEI